MPFGKRLPGCFPYKLFLGVWVYTDLHNNLLQPINGEETVTNISNLGEYLFKNVENTEKVWIDIFGRNFHKAWENPHTALCKIALHTQKYLNRNPTREGEATLLIRDPLSDRLNLLCSTNGDLNPNAPIRPNEKYFSNCNEHFDGKQQTCFYTLCDRLTPDKEKSSQESQETRGLTGWVAVTGHFLRVNSASSQARLDDIAEDDPATKSACAKYGTPVWANHIAEFPRDDSPTWSKRFLAVPIKSISDPNTTIGVLRYTTLPQGNVLTEVDTIFIKSMAEIASVVLNLEQSKTKSIRNYQRDLNIRILQDSYDVYSYLEHLAITLNSNISSLYISLNIHGNRVLRLFDAFGVSGYIGKLRDQKKLSDYNQDTKGLTYKLYTDKDDNPKNFNTVLEDSENWRGLNTAIFYGRSLKKHGIHDIQNKLEDPFEKRKILQTYSISKRSTNPICHIE